MVQHASALGAARTGRRSELDDDAGTVPDSLLKVGGLSGFEQVD
jgi:hypothetical protein